MATAALLDGSSLESTLLGRQHTGYDRYRRLDGSPDTLEAEKQEYSSRPSRNLRLRLKPNSLMEDFEQDSPEVTRQDEGSAGRVSSSEHRAERRNRAKKGSMRDYSTSSDEEFEGPRRRRGNRGLSDPKYKKSLSDFHFERPDPITAAKNKATRERQRRERLNDSFAELVKTLDPEGSIKGEKTSIIAGTIRSINSLRKDNEKLRKEKSEMQDQMNRIEEEKRDTDFQRAMVERQLEDLRLSVYGTQRMPSPLGNRAEPAGQMDINRSQQQSPSGGLSQMLQEQASLQGAVQRGPLGPLEAQMFQQEGRPQQALGNSFMPLDQPMTQQPGGSGALNQVFNENTDYLDILANDVTADGMSLSPVQWLNDALGPEADESYMCSNL